MKFLQIVYNLNPLAGQALFQGCALIAKPFLQKC